MLRILGNRKRLCDGLTRRELIQAGSLGLFGPGLADLLRRQELRAAESNASSTFGRAKSCIVLFLYGAWSQLDTLDPKPDAPEEIRGEFKPIATSVPGLSICEHLPRVARLMDRVALVRSMTHPYPTHGVAYALSGVPENPERNPRTHWPFYGSVLDYLWARDLTIPPAAGIPRNICMPWPLNSHSANQSHRGLSAAWLGSQWETVFAEFAGQASRDKGAPSINGPSRLDPFDGITPESTFQFMAPTIVSQAPKVGLEHKIARSGLELPPDVTLDRLGRRLTLLQQFDSARRRLDNVPDSAGYDRFQAMALDMITSPKCSAALDVAKEPTAVRERYGYTLFGQGALAARRLIEAGVRVVTLYWDEFGPANTGWDTHVNNFPRLKEGLCPTLDQVYSTLLDDLDERGMLDETVVLLMSEHGRTPKVSRGPGGGREHWSGAYCGAFAGAGIRRGTVIGATDKQALYPTSRPTNPKDILATMYHLLGIDLETARTQDATGRQHPLLPYGQIVRELFA